MQDFRSLTVWRKAHELALQVYAATRPFPADERYGLTSQMRRCVVSIGSNIAEGCGRDTSADFGRFLDHAIGSTSELEYQLLLSRDLGFLQPQDYDGLHAQAVAVKKMLASLRNKLRRPMVASDVAADDDDPTGTN